MDLSDLTIGVVDSPSSLVDWAGWFERAYWLERPILYRGHSRTYGTLLPSLARALRELDYDAITLLESRLLNKFRLHYSELHSLPGDMPRGQDLMALSDADVSILMQHYEVPSRFLDWSESIWVATFFACSSSPDQDAELWFVSESVFDPTPVAMPAATVRDIVCSCIGKRPCHHHSDWGMPYLALMTPISNPRLSAQKGRLTASDDARVDHVKLLRRLVTLKSKSGNPARRFGRLSIKSSCKKDVLRFLSDSLRISARTLFPDIVGVERYLHWEFEAMRTELS